MLLTRPLPVAEATGAVYGASYDAARASALAEQGLRHVGARRDVTWAFLASFDLERRETSDPDFPGIPLDVPERHEVWHVLIPNLPFRKSRELRQMLVGVAPGDLVPEIDKAEAAGAKSSREPKRVFDELRGSEPFESLEPRRDLLASRRHRGSSRQISSRFRYDGANALCVPA